MNLKVTRFSRVDARLYSVEYGMGICPGMTAAEVKNWLFDLGVGDSDIAAVLDMEPSESVTIDVPERKDHFRRQAS